MYREGGPMAQRHMNSRYVTLRVGPAGRAEVVFELRGLGREAVLAIPQ